MNALYIIYVNTEYSLYLKIHLCLYMVNNLPAADKTDIIVYFNYLTPSSSPSAARPEVPVRTANDAIVTADAVCVMMMKLLQFLVIVSIVFI